MSHDDSQDAVLSFALETYKQDDPMKIVAAIASMKVERAAKAKAPKKAPKAAKPIPVPFVQTLNAVQFMAAIHEASKVPGETRNEKTCKSDLQLGLEAKAIQGYCGYLKSSPHGLQLDIAVRRANAQLRPDLLRDKPKSDPSIQGYVAGAADHEAKGIANLLARETLAVSRMTECLRISELHGAKDAGEEWHKFLCSLDPNKDPATIPQVSDSEARKLAKGYAAMEQERLDPSRADLQAAGYFGEFASPPLTSRIQVSWKEETPIEETASE